MSREIDEQVLQMTFDHQQFDSGIKQSLSMLDKLRSSLNMQGVADNVSSVMDKAFQAPVAGVEATLEKASNKISAWTMAKFSLIDSLTKRALQSIERVLNTVTISSFDVIKSGWEEFDLKNSSIKVIQSSTGESLETISEQLDKLNEYADKTIYSFSDMTNNIGKFTNAGVKLDKAVGAIQGVSSLAAVSGAGAAEASRAMYNFAQALSSGYVKLIDWKSIENANMATVEFKNELIKTALELGTVKREGDKYVSTTTNLNGNVSEAFDATKMFNDSLAHQWMTTDVLTKTLARYSDETTEIGAKAMKAATEVRSFKMMMDALKEAAGSGWVETFEKIVGNFQQTKDFFTNINKYLSIAVEGASRRRNRIVEDWRVLGGRRQAEVNIYRSLEIYLSYLTEIRNALDNSETGSALAERFIKIGSAIDSATRALRPTIEWLNKVRTALGGVIGNLSLVADLVGDVITSVVGGAFGIWSRLADNIADFIIWMNNGIRVFLETIKTSQVLNKSIGSLYGTVNGVVSIFKTLYDILVSFIDAKAATGLFGGMTKSGVGAITVVSLLSKLLMRKHPFIAFGSSIITLLTTTGNLEKVLGFVTNGLQNVENFVEKTASSLRAFTVGNKKFNSVIKTLVGTLDAFVNLMASVAYFVKAVVSALFKTTPAAKEVKREVDSNNTMLTRFNKILSIVQVALLKITAALSKASVYVAVAARKVSNFIGILKNSSAFEIFAGVLERIKEGLHDFIKMVKDGVDAVASYVDSNTTVGSVVSNVLDVISSVVGGIQTLWDEFRNGDPVQAFSDNVDSAIGVVEEKIKGFNPLEEIGKTDIGSKFLSVFETVANVVKDVASRIASVATTIWDFTFGNEEFINTLKLAGETILSFGDMLLAAAGFVAEFVRIMLGAVALSIDFGNSTGESESKLEKFNKILKLVQKGLTYLRNKFKKAAEKIREATENLESFMRGIAESDSFKRLEQHVKNINNKVGGLLEKLWKAVKDFFKKLINGKEDAENDVTDTEKVFDAAKFIENAMDGISNALEFVGQAWQKVKDVWGKIKEGVEKVVEALKEAFEWINDKRLKALEKFHSIIESIEEKFSKLKEILSPAKKEIQNTGETVENEMGEKTYNNPISALFGFVDKFRGGMGEVNETAKTEMGKLSDTIGGKDANFSKSILGLFGDTSTVKSGISSILSNIAQGINDGLKNFNLETGLDTGMALSLIWLVWQLGRFLKSISYLTNSSTGVIKDFVKRVTKPLTTFGTVLQEMADNIEAQTVLIYARAIAVLAGSIVALTMVNEDQLYTAAGILIILILLMMQFAKVMAKTNSQLKSIDKSKTKTINETTDSNNVKMDFSHNVINIFGDWMKTVADACAAAMRNVGLALLVFSVVALIGSIVIALYALKDYPFKQTKNVLIAVGAFMVAIMGVLVLILYLVSEKRFNVSGKRMAALALLIHTLSGLLISIVIAFAGLALVVESHKPESVNYALGAICMILLVMAATVALMAVGLSKLQGNALAIVAMAPVIIALTAAIVLISITMAVLASLPINYGNALVLIFGIIVMVGAFVGLSAIVGKWWETILPGMAAIIGFLTLLSIDMVLMSIALTSILGTIMAFKLANPNDILKFVVFVLTFVGILAAIGAFGGVIAGVGLIGLATGLILLSAGLLAFLAALKAYSGTDAKTMATGIKNVGEALKVFAGHVLSLVIIAGVGLIFAFAMKIIAAAAQDLGMSILGLAGAAALFGIAFAAVGFGLGYLVEKFASAIQLLDGHMHTLLLLISTVLIGIVSAVYMAAHPIAAAVIAVIMAILVAINEKADEFFAVLASVIEKLFVAIADLLDRLIMRLGPRLVITIERLIAELIRLILGLIEGALGAIPFVKDFVKGRLDDMDAFEKELSQRRDEWVKEFEGEEPEAKIDLKLITDGEDPKTSGQQAAQEYSTGWAESLNSGDGQATLVEGTKGGFATAMSKGVANLATDGSLLGNIQNASSFMFGETGDVGAGSFVEGWMNNSDLQGLGANVNDMFTSDYLTAQTEVVPEVGNKVSENYKSMLQWFKGETEEDTAKVIKENVVHAGEEGTAEMQTQTMRGIEAMRQAIIDETGSVEAANEYLRTVGFGGYSKLYGEMYNHGQNVVIGFVNGMMVRMTEAKAAARALAQTTADVTARTAEIRSPSRVAFRLGSYWGEGFVNGVADWIGRAKNTAATMGHGAIDMLKSAVTKAGDVLASDPNLTPTIRPVLDASGIQNGVGYLNSMLSNGSYSVGVNRVYARNGMLSDLVNATSDIRRSDSGVTDAITALNDNMADLGNRIEKMQVRLDDGTLVGHITAPLDASLGRRAALKARNI